MYGKYNSDTLMELVKTVHQMQNVTTWKEIIFVSEMNEWLKCKLADIHDEFDYSIDAVLFLTTVKEKYVRMYEKFILFVVKSKHKYSCVSAVYFNSNIDIKENCDFYYYHNESDVTPSVLDGGRQIILANWPNCKRIICTYNNNIPVNITSHPYVLLDRNILCKL